MWEHFNKAKQLNDVQIFLFVKDTQPIRLKSCAIWQVWAYPLRVEQAFSTPKIYRQIEGPNYWKHLRNGKTSTFI